MFVVCILVTLAALCAAIPQETILLERDVNYALPRNYGGQPNHEELLELYERRIGKDQEQQLLRQWQQVLGSQKLVPHQRPVNLNDALYYRNLDEQLRHHHQRLNDYSQGHKILVSDHNTFIEFNRLKLLAKEAEHYFRPEFNGHKLRHQELIAYIEQLLRFGAEREKLRNQNANYQRVNSQEESLNYEERQERERPHHIVVSEENENQKPNHIADVERLLRPHEEINPAHILNQEILNNYRKNEYREQRIDLEKPPRRNHEEKKVNPNVALFVPNNEKLANQYFAQAEQGQREVCINCGYYNQ